MKFSLNYPGLNLKQIPNWLWPVITFFLMLSIFASLQTGQSPTSQSVAYSQFKQLVQAGDVTEVIIEGESLSAELKAVKTFENGAGPTKNVATILPSTGDPQLQQILDDN